MSNTRPSLNRRPREVSPEQEAKIEAFAREAETLQNGTNQLDPAKAAVVSNEHQKVAGTAKQPKSRSYTFRMTEETLNKLRAAADAEERSIQWVFDRLLLPSLDK